MNLTNVDISSSGQSFVHPQWFAEVIVNSEIAFGTNYSFVVANFGTCAEVFFSKNDIKIYVSGQSSPSLSGSCSFIM